MTEVIYIDDNEALRRLALNVLTRWYRVHVFSDPHEAIIFIKTIHSRPVIVCDYDMPGLSGLDVYERLPSIHRQRFILFTGNIKVSSPSGRTVYKPASFQQLKQVIDEV